MSKKEPKKMEDIDWEALEREDNLKYAGKDSETYDEAAIEEEKKLLSEEEKSSPYPDDFLADINLMNKSIKNNQQTQAPDKSNEDSE